MEKFSLSLIIVGALNWLLMGAFRFDLIAYICGGQGAVLSRIIYALVGLCGLWSLGLLFRQWRPMPVSNRM